MQRVKTSKKAKTDMEKIQAENLKSVFFPYFLLGQSPVCHCGVFR